MADALAADPADPRTLAEFAVHVAASPRTLARLFVSQTGLGFGRWRKQARPAVSLPLLAAGLPVARIAGWSAMGRRALTSRRSGGRSESRRDSISPAGQALVPLSTVSNAPVTLRPDGPAR